MTATFTTTTLYIYDTTTVHLKGGRNLSARLWYIDLAYQAPVPLEPLLHYALFPGQPQANNVYKLTKKTGHRDLPISRMLQSSAQHLDCSH